MASSWDSRGGGPGWGDPVSVLESANAPTIEPSQEDPAWGRTDTLVMGSGVSRHTMVQIHLRECQPILITAQTLVPPGTAVNSGGQTIKLYPWIQVIWGNGSTSVQRSVRCDDITDTTISASWVRAWAYMGDINGVLIELASLNPAGQANPPSMQMSVFAARGLRGLPYIGTRRFTNASNLSNAGLLSLVPRELMSIHAHLTAASVAPLYFQLFDSPTIPNNGDTPVEEYALSASVTAPEAGERFINPFAFSQSVAYGISTTSGVLTKAVGVSAFVSAEIMNM